MRAVFALFLATASLWFTACANNEGPSGDEVQEQLRRGVTGQGQITPGLTDNAGDRDRSDGTAGGGPRR